MPPLTIHLDGLWRCLCPAIDGAWARHLRSPHRRIAAATAGMACRHQPRRALQTAKPRLKYAGGTPKQRLRGGDRYRRNGLDGVPLSEIQLEEILDGLDYAAFNGQIDEVQHLVAHLMEQRGASPSLQIYAALIMVNIDAERGSAATAEALFNELREKGFTPNSTVYHNLLKVLSIHPNYLLRSQVLEEMQERWIPVSRDGSHDVVAGLVRDAQLELALDGLESMERQGLDPDRWLWDMVIYALMDREEFDEALAVVRRRYHTDDRIVRSSLWAHLLDTASKALHHEATSYVWKRQVERVMVVPSDGVCLNVLHTAARHGDPDLAADVFRTLSNRGATLELHHYEGLAEAYVSSSDIESAMAVFCIAQRVGLTVQEGSVACVFRWLGHDRDRLERAFKAVCALAREGRRIPVACVNILIQAAGRHEHAAAMQMYGMFEDLCQQRPTTATFNALMGACLRGDRKGVGVFLREEMAAMRVEPDARTYHGLLRLCSAEHDLANVKRFFREMAAQGFVQGPTACLAIIKAFAKWSDKAMWAVLGEMRQLQISSEDVEDWVQSHSKPR